MVKRKIYSKSTNRVIGDCTRVWTSVDESLEEPKTFSLIPEKVTRRSNLLLLQ